MSLSGGVVLGIPAIVYLLALYFSWHPLTGFNLKSLRESLAEIPRIAMGVILLFLVLNISFCLLPPAENQEMDALNYHFVIPWQYYLRGGVIPLDWSIPDKYPLYFQIAQLPFMVISFPWVVKIGTMMALPLLLVVGWHLCRTMGLSRNHTAWAVATLSSLALFVKQYGTAMFDLVYTAYFLLAFLYLLRATLSRKGTEMFLGGMILGMACAAKTFFIYYAIVWFVASVVWRLIFKRQGFSRFDWMLSVFPLLAAILFMLPVWWRNTLLTGNPFYPLFLQWFGPVIENKGFYVSLLRVAEAGYGRSLLDFLLAPLRFILPFSKKFDYWTDPILLLFWVGAVMEIRRRWREIAGLVGLVIFLLYIAFFFTSQEARYLYPFWVLIIALGTPSIFRRIPRKVCTSALVAQVVIGVSALFFFHRQAITWLFQGPLNQYLSRASYSFVWNKEVEGKSIKQLCLPNVGTAHRDVFDILYFTVPVKLVQHFNTTMSIRNPRAAEGCDTFMVGNQNPNEKRDEPNNKPLLVSRETFLLEHTKDTYELAK